MELVASSNFAIEWTHQTRCCFKSPDWGQKTSVVKTCPISYIHWSFSITMVNFYPWLGMVYYYNSKIRSAKFGFRFNQAAGSLLCLFYYWIFIQWNPLCPWKNWLSGFKVICGKLSYCGTFHVIFLRNLVQVQCFCRGFNFWHWTCFWFSNKCLVSWNCSLEEESISESVTVSVLLKYIFDFNNKKEYKVHIFWEGHKILRNLHLTFVCMYCRQK